jgi:hypothetical protein
MPLPPLPWPRCGHPRSPRSRSRCSLTTRSSYSWQAAQARHVVDRSLMRPANHPFTPDHFRGPRAQGPFGQTSSPDYPGALVLRESCSKGESAARHWRLLTSRSLRQDSDPSLFGIRILFS